MLIVSFLPNTPGGQHENVHKERLAPLLFTSTNQPDAVVIIRPVDPQFGPTLHTERAVEEEVFHRLFWWLIAQQASIVVVCDVITTVLEHVPGVQSVHHQELAEHFEFDGAFGFP